MRLAGCRAELYVFDQHLATVERELASRRQALEATTLPVENRARLRREIENLNVIYKRTMGEMDDVEIRCLNQL